MIQKLLISLLLNPLGKLVDHLSERTKDHMFVLFGLLLFVVYFVSNTSSMQSAPYIVFFAAGCLCMGMMILSMLRKDIQPVHFSPVLLILWLSVGALITIAALRFNADWLSDAIIYVAACPAAFIVWGNMNHKKLFSLLIRSCILSFAIFFVISAVFYPVGIKQYESFFTNPNGVSGYLALVFSCLMVYSFQADQLKKRIGSWLLLGLCSGVLYYTNSRSGQLAAICTFAFTSTLFLLSGKNMLKQRLFWHVIPIILSVLLFIPGTLYIMQASNAGLSGIASLPLEAKASDLLTKEHTTSSSVIHEDKAYTDFDTINESNKGRYNFLEKDFNEITTGRVDIWKAFMEEVTMWGTGEEANFYIESQQRIRSNPHMTLMLYAYQYGWLCAVVWLLFNILAGLKSIKFVFRNKMDAIALFPFAITIVYGLVFLVETINTPFVYMITMFYYFVQTPLITTFPSKLDSETPNRC